MPMKKLFMSLIFVAIVQMIFANTNSSYIDEDPEKIDIECEDITKGEGHQRTVSIVSAYLNRASTSVDVTLYNIGTATVRILNSYGEVIGISIANTDFPVTVNLPIPPAESLYLIEIISSNYHAFGNFTL